MLIKQIKADQLTARKTRQGVKTSILTTLLGELETDSKSKGGGEITDEKVLAKIKKFLKGIDEVVSLTEIGSEKHATGLLEVIILESYLPKQFSEDELKEAILACILSKGIERLPKNMGVVMKELKSEYDGKYDGKMASQIVKHILA
jgi:uncharacterized protein YqeY